MPAQRSKSSFGLYLIRLPIIPDICPGSWRWSGRVSSIQNQDIPSSNNLSNPLYGILISNIGHENRYLSGFGNLGFGLLES